jgi:hypothetical protein
MKISKKSTDTSNFKIIRKNEIKYKEDNTNRLFAFLPFHKYGENKSIGGVTGLNFIEIVIQNYIKFRPI